MAYLSLLAARLVIFLLVILTEVLTDHLVMDQDGKRPALQPDGIGAPLVRLFRVT